MKSAPKDQLHSYTHNEHSKRLEDSFTVVPKE